MQDVYSSSMIRAKLLLFAAVTFAFTLAASHAGPREDLKSFLLEDKATWDSTGHPKAAGLRIKLSYPKSWAAEEASRPHIVQQFTSDSGRGFESFMVQVNPLSERVYADFSKLNNEEKKQALDVISTSLLPQGGRLVSHSVTQIDGEDCGMMEYEYEGQTAGMAIAQKLLNFVIVRHGSLLMLSGSVGGDATSGFSEIEKRYAATKPLFQQIAATCVLTDKWLPKHE